MLHNSYNFGVNVSSNELLRLTSASLTPDNTCYTLDSRSPRKVWYLLRCTNYIYNRFYILHAAWLGIVNTLLAIISSTDTSHIGPVDQWDEGILDLAPNKIRIHTWKLWKVLQAQGLKICVNYNGQQLLAPTANTPYCLIWPVYAGMQGVGGRIESEADLGSWKQKAQLLDIWKAFFSLPGTSNSK